jgi:hypothetical protein
LKTRKSPVKLGDHGWRKRRVRLGGLSKRIHYLIDEILTIVRIHLEDGGNDLLFTHDGEPITPALRFQE